MTTPPSRSLPEINRTIEQFIEDPYWSAQKAFEIELPLADWRAIHAKLSEKQGWVSVADRLPEHGDVLCATRGGNVDIYVHQLVGEYADGRQPGDSAITHWMPLPEAPK